MKGTDEQGRGESNGESKTTTLTSEPPKSTSGPTEVVLVKPKKDKKLKEKKARSNNIIDKKVSDTRLGIYSTPAEQGKGNTGNYR